jgi:vacuolar-type H+-ATPase subunit I/STV1
MTIRGDRKMLCRWCGEWFPFWFVWNFPEPATFQPFMCAPCKQKYDTHIIDTIDIFHRRQRQLRSDQKSRRRQEKGLEYLQRLQVRLGRFYQLQELQMKLECTKRELEQLQKEPGSEQDPVSRKQELQQELVHLQQELERLRSISRCTSLVIAPCTSLVKFADSRRSPPSHMLGQVNPALR